MYLRKLGFSLLIACLFFNFLGYGQTKIDSLKTVLTKESLKSEKLKVLNELTKQMIRKNHKELIPNLKTYISLAKELREYDFMASKSRFLVQQYILKGENKIALQLCDSMLSFQEKFKKKSSKAHILLKRGGIYFSELNYDKAIKDYKASANLFLASKDSIFGADAYYFSGQAYSNSGNFIKAISSYEKAYELYEVLKDYNYMFQVGHEVDLIYRRNGLREIANEKLNELISKSRNFKAFSTLRFLFLVKTEELIKDNKLKEANKSLDSVKKYRKYITDVVVADSDKLQVNSIELRLRLKENNMKSADTLYQQRLLLEKRIKHKKVENELQQDKADYLTKKGKTSEALQLLLAYENYAKKNSLNNNLLESEKLLAKIYEQLGNTQKALVHHKRYIKLKDSIQKRSLTNALAFQQTKFETELKEKEIIKNKAEIKLLETDKKLARSKRNTLLSVLFSVILLAIGVWWREKSKRLHLKKELHRNKNELTDFTKRLLLKSKEQEELKFQLEVLKDKITEKETINSIQELMNYKILTKDDWYLFKDKFVRVHPQFFSDIKGKGYKLTKSEERLVALEKLGLDNTEIANMLGVSVDSVFISRYRLRKKINAPKEIPLIEYLG